MYSPNVSSLWGATRTDREQEEWRAKKKQETEKKKPGCDRSAPACLSTVSHESPHGRQLRPSGLGSEDSCVSGGCDLRALMGAGKDAILFATGVLDHWQASMTPDSSAALPPCTPDETVVTPHGSGTGTDGVQVGAKRTSREQEEWCAKKKQDTEEEEGGSEVISESSECVLSPGRMGGVPQRKRPLCPLFCAR